MGIDETVWSPKQIDEIASWLSSKWGSLRPCAQCGAALWSIAENPAHVPLAFPNGEVRLGTGFPCIAVFCQNCGNTIFINSIVAGIKPPTTMEAGNG